ncbi:N-formylglutamate amidohydrolase [Caulobacter sp. 17J65-9]|uniref:N-formylglutamate amidohydrolase n=1 Tax=Caulobacter sp. 17J65-9 TaxID=2709382 RepID=UPI0013C7C037|nr:N-formylglutamate amidohydrolase [Caulobacter sp. 17J65-9]NEX93244.1 N-formylglutamate amidohydrolase [Caulobacter sp. 17J65-9]
MTVVEPIFAAPSDSDPDAAAPFELSLPAQTASALVFASPHSGRIYPDDLVAASALDALALRRSEDAFVDRFVLGAREHGIAAIACRVARAYVDVNRDPWELDPAMFEDALPAFARSQSARVAAGLGSIAKVVGEGQAIYRRKLRFSEAAGRIARVHAPYHHALKELVEAAHAGFGQAVLIDWHSMPSAAVKAEQRRGRGRPDVVLGDRHGEACARGLTALVRREFESMGYVVALNRPYAGGYTTQSYGRPTEGRHALQIELNRSLYLDEARMEPVAGFERLKADLDRMAVTLAAADWSAVLRA